MLVNGKPYRSIWLKDNIVNIIDQRKLPHSFEIEELKTVDDVVKAIKDMHVRGAPLIGITAAYGMYLACLNNDDLINASEKLKSARPTAIDLAWAVDKINSKIKNKKTSAEKTAIALKTVKDICENSVKQCKLIGEHGAKVIEEISKKKNDVVNILTHCNAGWLATVDYGTATAPIYVAFERGIKLHVWVDETRPRNQGYLTAWELSNMNIPNTIIADNTGGHLMQRGMVDLVLVGSDRTTLQGDVTNKIGTYLKALAAKDNNVPFYVALPSSSIDWHIKDSKNIPIEQRDADELNFIQGLNKNNEIVKVRITPERSNAANYAFDITPSGLVTGLITEKGICKANKESILALFPERKNG